MDREDVIEQTLFIAVDVHVYRIPPRPAAGGVRSGEWRVADEIFKGRLRVVSIGENAELRFEDVSTNELFALAPISFGQRHIVVESAADSSRNFVVRVENPENNAHAFLGMGFETRDVAFDFSAALEDHDRRMARQSTETGSSDMSPEIAALHKPVADLRLKEGQTIRVDIKNKIKTPKNPKSIPSTPPVLTPPPATKSTQGEKSWATFD